MKFYQTLKTLIKIGIRNNNAKKFGKVGKCVNLPFKMKGINCPSNIFFDDYSSVGTDVIMYATKVSKIVVGKGSIIAPRCKLISSNHNYNSEDLRSIPYDNRNFAKDIIIEDGAWIGDSAIILAGVIIGKGAVVGGGSVVNRNVPDYAVVVGNPARVVKYRNKEVFDRLLVNKAYVRSIDWTKEGGKDFIDKTDER